MFGNFGMGMYFGNSKPSESIERKLKDPKTEIEDLLRDEDLLQEFRSQNEKLIEYFDRNKIKRLIDYTIKEPEVDEQERGYTFPFLCSQIFGLEIDKMIEHFFVTNKQLKEENKKNEKKEEKNEANEEKLKDQEISGESARKEENKEVQPEQKEKKNDMDENKNIEDKKEETGNIKEGESKEGEKKEDVDKENKNEAKIGENKGEEKKIIEGEPKEEDKANKDGAKDGIKKEDEKKENEDEVKEENKNKKEGEKVEEISQKEESEENRMELLDHLFTFLPEKEEEGKRLNYVLCGYFSSIISNLLSISPTELLKYIYNVRSDILYKMVNHYYRKSISDTLSRILHFENYFQSEDSLDKDTRHNMEEKRKEILSEIFQKIDINKDNEDLNSIYFLITGLFDQAIEEEKLILKSIIDNKENMKALITKPLYNLDLAKDDKNVENKRNNFMVIIDIIIFLLNSAKKVKLELPINESDSINHTEFSKEIFDNLGGIIKNIFNKKIEVQKPILQSFNEYQLTPLGEYKIKIIDLLSHIIPYFKNISKVFDQLLIDNEFFTHAFNYLYEYEWNNIYQESLLSLLKSLINDADNHELIQDYLFNKLKIIEVIKKYTNSEDKYKLNNKENISNPISHGYYSFFISLSYKINTALGGTPVDLKNNTIARQGSFSFMAKPKENTMSSLFGYFGEDENNGNEAEKEEEKYNYETMKKYINDEWKLLFGNISEVIKQYENRTWPEEDQKDKESSFAELPGQKLEGDNLKENNEANDGEKNIVKGDDNKLNGNDNDGSQKEVGEQGNNNNDENSSSKDVNKDGKDSGGKDNEKEEQNKLKENESKNEGVVQGKETEKIEAKVEEKPGNTKDEGKKEEKKEDDGNKKDSAQKEENKEKDNKKEIEKTNK